MRAIIKSSDLSIVLPPQSWDASAFASAVLVATGICVTFPAGEPVDVLVVEDTAVVPATITSGVPNATQLLGGPVDTVTPTSVSRNYPVRDKTGDEIAAENRVRAQALLDAADKTVTRIAEAVSLGLNTWTSPDVVAWMTYRRALRGCVASGATLPDVPPYPVGT